MSKSRSRTASAKGKPLLAAVESSQRVVATGTQQRSWGHFLEAKELVAQGALGKITFARCHWSQNYDAFRAQATEIPDPNQLDWDGWLGPAPKQAFDATRFYFWRFFWDFGGGSVTDLMTHWIDVIQWYMGSPQVSEVRAFGTTYTNHWLEAPDTVVATMAFPEGYTAVFEGNMTFGLLGCGIEFRGDKAMMILNRDGYSIYEEGAMPLEAVALPEPTYEYRRVDSSSWSERVDGSGTLDNLRDWLGLRPQQGSSERTHPGRRRIGRNVALGEQGDPRRECYCGPMKVAVVQSSASTHSRGVS